MMGARSLLIAATLVALLPASAAPQALPNLGLLRVTYNTRKATVKPQGDLKAQIDEIDKAIADAMRLGRTGEARRLIAKGMTLLSGRPWTETAEFAHSLVLRSDRVVIDSSKPYSARIEQIYSPAIELPHTLTAHAVLRRRPAPVTTMGATPEPGGIVKDLGALDGVSRDLRESPLQFEADLHDVADGAYQLAVEVFDDDRSLGSTTLDIAVRNHLYEQLTRLEATAGSLPEPIRADVLYPADHIRNIDRGRVAIGAFDVSKEIALAEGVVRSATSGTDPFAGKTGDFKRHYLLDAAGEIMPYRVYIPTGYRGSHPTPLVIVLHGLGGTEDSMFGSLYGSVLSTLAEQHGFIVAAPLGYRVDGFYGYRYAPAADQAGRRKEELSERDVMEVLQRMKQYYTIDDSRIYLMGHSMGAIGTWVIAASHPDVWAALGPISGTGDPALAERMRSIPEIVVHGDADPTVNVRGSRAMVEALGKLGVEVKYIEVRGGNHTDVAASNFPLIFNFFEAHRKRAHTSP
jgi:poly(3-hydroxybutyrate) depolymerase